MFVYITVPVKQFALAAAGLACTGLLLSCGGGGEEPTVISGHERVAVIEGWAQDLAAGNVEAAAGYFALPSLAENGPSPITLRSRADAISFNRSLPCGARLVRARPRGRFIVATFRLTERPGGDCGSGDGRLARTAFAIRDGKITQWRRLADPPQHSGEGPIV
ncbi:MAG: hypothetical protein ACRDKV_06835 [Solirubrobacterales bacterium]